VQLPSEREGAVPDWLPVLDVDPDLIPWLALAGLALGTVAVVLALSAHLRVRRVQALWRRVGVDATGVDVLGALDRQREELDRLRHLVGRARVEVDELRADVGDALRHVAVVRYDAFGDLGGRLSFSAAVLDDDGDGIVLTSINGRSETRTYAKGVKAGRSELALSPEEEQAIGHARRGVRPHST
jgi:hypothetical protein